MIPIRPASTLVILRQANPQFEVCMLKRSLESEFVSGAYVFPGGRVDEDDKDRDLYERCSPLDDASASKILEIEEDGLAFYICAVRETFEEAGVLFAKVPSGSLDQKRISNLRSRVLKQEISFREMVLENNLTIDLSTFRYFSHWITPKGPPKRYDTRFFVAQLGADQSASHDGFETTNMVWISPSQAINDHLNNQFEIIFPTLKNLERLNKFQTIEDLYTNLASLKNIATVEPKIIEVNGTLKVLIPGDPEYDG